MRRTRGRFERLIIKGALWVGIVLLVLLAVFLAGSTWEVYQKEQTAKQELTAVENKRDSLEKRKETLSEDLEALKSERGIEAELRERFPVVKDGEEVIVLVDASNQVGADIEASPASFWDRIKGWFGF